MRFCTNCKTNKPEFHKAAHICKDCANARARAWRIKNLEKAKKNCREWRKRNPIKVIEGIARWKAWKKANHLKVAAQSAEYRKRNLAYYAAKANERRALKIKAKPKWANDFFIEEAYRLARLRTEMLGFEWHVDHIVPLKSNRVCGLHVEHNLQVIPGSENYAKRNYRWPDMSA